MPIVDERFAIHDTKMPSPAPQIHALGVMVLIFEGPQPLSVLTTMSPVSSGVATVLLIMKSQSAFE